VSGRNLPPRLRPRAVPPAPAQPYPVASDFDVPLDEEPIPLTSDAVPTMQDLSDQIGAVKRDLSEQIGAQSSHIQVVHREASLGRAAAVNAGLEAKACRGDVAELRALVLGDHAPRITQVEARTSRITIPPGAKAGGIGVGAGGIVVALVELWPLVQRWIESR
jgi:hypothetical protein